MSHPATGWLFAFMARLTTLKPRLQTLGQRTPTDGGSGWAASQQGKTTTQRGYGWAWQKLREAILMRDFGLCQVCKAAGIARIGREVDHITPKSQGGTDHAGNLRCICSECHAAKTGAEARGQVWNESKPDRAL